MHTMYYKPTDGWAADFIPFYHDGEYHLFYLHDWRDTAGHGEGVPWRRISTRDFINFTEHGEMLERGASSEQDLYVFTGCVLRAQGRFHIFYTGHNPHLRAQGRPEQAVMHAVSDDLQNWTKLKDELFFAPAGDYEPHDWRDPFVFFDENDKKYHMLLAARTSSGPLTRRGCTAHCVSDDLVHWDVKAPLFQPDSYFTHECPDFFRIGDWYYLIFSEFTDLCRTRYVMGRSMYGPWLCPKDDVFDTRAYYAAKSASDGQRRYLFGWNPTRSGESDREGFQWGGSLVVHELVQQANGELSVREPNSLSRAWKGGIMPVITPWVSPRKDSPENHKDCQGNHKECREGHGEGKNKELPDASGSVTLNRDDGFASAAIDMPLQGRYRVTFNTSFSEGTRAFGIQLRANKAEDTSYGINFLPDEHQMTMAYLPNPTWGNLNDRGLSRRIALEPERPMRVTVTVEDSIVECYVDDRISFSSRMYDLKGEHMAFYVRNGCAVFNDILVYTD